MLSLNEKLSNVQPLGLRATFHVLFAVLRTLARISQITQAPQPHPSKFKCSARGGKRQISVCKQIFIRFSYYSKNRWDISKFVHSYQVTLL